MFKREADEHVIEDLRFKGKVADISLFKGHIGEPLGFHESFSPGK